MPAREEESTGGKRTNENNNNNSTTGALFSKGAAHSQPTALQNSLSRRGTHTHRRPAAAHSSAFIRARCCCRLLVVLLSRAAIPLRAEGKEDPPSTFSVRGGTLSEGP